MSIRRTSDESGGQPTEIFSDSVTIIAGKLTVRALIDSDWYFSTYSDIKDAGVDAVKHYFEYGANEGRRPNPFFYSTWYKETYINGVDTISNPLEHYVNIGSKKHFKPNPLVDPVYMRKQYELSDDEDPLLHLIENIEIDHVSEWFSRLSYLAENPDIEVANLFPEEHYLEFGIYENRNLASGYSVSRSDLAKLHDPTEIEINKFQFCGYSYLVSTKCLSPTILKQIRVQAEIDPDVGAVGIDSVPYLRQFVATDIETRNLVDYQTLLDEVPMNQDAILILPRLSIGGAEKFTANLVRGLKMNGLSSIVVITTESLSSDDQAAMSHEILSGLRDVRIVSSRELLKRTWIPENTLSCLLLRASPKHLFVINSELGLKTVMLYGKALSTIMNIVTAFFSESPFAVGAPYSARYIRDVLPYSNILSDNKVALQKWYERVGKIGGKAFLCLPPLVDVPSDRQFERRLGARKQALRENEAIRALWVSRWEPFKALDVLCLLAELVPELKIDAYGPYSRDNVHSYSSNITLLGPTSKPSKLPLEDYDLMIFTSYFEGLPNVILEMAVAGIPIVASDVGGLRETFDETTLELVNMSGDTEAIARRFKHSVRKVTSESVDDSKRRMLKAREQVKNRHNIDAFNRNVAKMLKRLE